MPLEVGRALLDHRSKAATAALPLEEDCCILPIIAERRIASNTCRHSGVLRLECHSEKLTMVCSPSADCRDSPSKDEKERRARGLISHGRSVPLLASRLAQFVPAFRLGSPADKAVSSSAEAVAVAEHCSLSEHLMQAHIFCTLCSHR